MTKNNLMAEIVKSVGRTEAHTLVLAAYNAEIISNRLSRMETTPTGLGRSGNRDLLQLALQRVHEIVVLSERT